MSRDSRIIKTISAAMAVIFLSQQVVWAAGDTPAEAAKAFSRANNMAQEYAQVSNIKVPSELAQVDASQPGKDELIVNIQDCHSSLTAQYSIVKILDELVRNYDIKLVAIEGAAGYIDTSILKSLPDAAVREKTASYLMKESKISAGEFFSVMSEGDVALYGVENNELYRENVKYFRSIYEKGHANIAVLDRVIANLKLSQDKMYSKSLSSLVYRSGLHRASKISFDVYWPFIEKMCRENGIPTDKYPAINGYQEAARLEKSINFKEATKERGELLDRLMKDASKEDLEEIVAKSIAFEKGKMDQYDFHKWLLATAVEKGVSPEGYPELSKYGDYVTNYRALNVIGLQKELEAAEANLLGKLFSSEKEKKLYRLTKTAELLKALFEIELLDNEVAFVKEALAEVKAEDILKFVDAASQTEVSGKLGNVLEEAKGAVKFYEVAEARSNAMIANTVASMRREGKRAAALISGGHHTTGLTSLMKEKGLSYLVLMPKYADDKARPYVAVLTKKTGPYKELAAGGSYDLALEAYFDTGDVTKLEEALVFTAAQEAEAGKDVKAELMRWAVSYRQAYNNITPARRELMVEEPVDPETFTEALSSMLVKKIGEGSYEVSVAARKYKVTGDTVEAVDPQEGKMPRSLAKHGKTGRIRGYFPFIVFMASMLGASASAGIYHPGGMTAAEETVKNVQSLEARSVDPGAIDKEIKAVSKKSIPIRDEDQHSQVTKETLEAAAHVIDKVLTYTDSGMTAPAKSDLKFLILMTMMAESDQFARRIQMNDGRARSFAQIEPLTGHFIIKGINKATRNKDLIFALQAALGKDWEAKLLALSQKAIVSEVANAVNRATGEEHGVLRDAFMNTLFGDFITNYKMRLAISKALSMDWAGVTAMQASDIGLKLAMNDFFAAAMARANYARQHTKAPSREDVDAVYKAYVSAWKPGKPIPKKEFSALAEIIVKSGVFEPKAASLPPATSKASLLSEKGPAADLPSLEELAKADKPAAPEAAQAPAIGPAQAPATPGTAVSAKTAEPVKPVPAAVKSQGKSDNGILSIISAGASISGVLAYIFLLLLWMDLGHFLKKGDRDKVFTIDLKNDLLSNRLIMSRILSCGREVAIGRMPNTTEYAFIAGDKDTVNSVFEGKYGEYFFEGHSHPSFGKTHEDVIAFMPAPRDLSVSHEGWQYILSDRGITWFQASPDLFDLPSVRADYEHFLKSAPLRSEEDIKRICRKKFGFRIDFEEVIFAPRKGPGIFPWLKKAGLTAAAVLFMLSLPGCTPDEVTKTCEVLMGLCALGFVTTVVLIARDMKKRARMEESRRVVLEEEERQQSLSTLLYNHDVPPSAVETAEQGRKRVTEKTGKVAWPPAEKIGGMVPIFLEGMRPAPPHTRGFYKDNINGEMMDIAAYASIENVSAGLELLESQMEELRDRQREGAPVFGAKGETRKLAYGHSGRPGALDLIEKFVKDPGENFEITCDVSTQPIAFYQRWVFATSDELTGSKEGKIMVNSYAAASLSEEEAAMLLLHEMVHQLPHQIGFREKSAGIFKSIAEPLVRFGIEAVNGHPDQLGVYLNTRKGRDEADILMKYLAHNVDFEMEAYAVQFKYMKYLSLKKGYSDAREYLMHLADSCVSPERAGLYSVLVGMIDADGNIANENEFMYMAFRRSNPNAIEAITRMSAYREKIITEDAYKAWLIKKLKGYKDSELKPGPAGHPFMPAAAWKWGWLFLGAGALASYLGISLFDISAVPHALSAGILVLGIYCLYASYGYFSLYSETARAVASEKALARRRSDGSIAYHGSFALLRPSTRERMLLHESSAGDVLGMLALLPGVYGIAKAWVGVSLETADREYERQIKNRLVYGLSDVWDITTVRGGELDDDETREATRVLKMHMPEFAGMRIVIDASERSRMETLETTMSFNEAARTVTIVFPKAGFTAEGAENLDIGSLADRMDRKIYAAAKEKHADDSMDGLDSKDAVLSLMDASISRIKANDDGAALLIKNLRREFASRKGLVANTPSSPLAEGASAGLGVFGIMPDDLIDGAPIYLMANYGEIVKMSDVERDNLFLHEAAHLTPTAREITLERKRAERLLRAYPEKREHLKRFIALAVEDELGPDMAWMAYMKTLLRSLPSDQLAPYLETMPVEKRADLVMGMRAVIDMQEAAMIEETYRKVIVRDGRFLGEIGKVDLAELESSEGLEWLVSGKYMLSLGKDKGTDSVLHAFDAGRALVWRRYMWGLLLASAAAFFITAGHYFYGNHIGDRTIVDVCTWLMGVFLVPTGYFMWAKERVSELGKDTYGALVKSGKIPQRFGRHEPIAERRGDEIFVHSAFEELTPWQKKMVLLHESFRSHFLGMIAIMPVVSFLAGWIVKTPRIQHDDFKQLPFYLENLRNETSRTADDVGKWEFAKTEGPVGFVTQWRPGRFTERDFEPGEDRPRQSSVYSGSRESLIMNGWSFSLTDAREESMPRQIDIRSMENASQDILNKAHFQQAIEIRQNLSSGKVIWTDPVLSDGRDLHFHAYEWPGKLPVERREEEPLLIDENGDSAVFCVRDYPSADNAIAVFGVRGRANETDTLSARCYNVERILRANGLQVDKIFVEDRSGAGGGTTVYFFPRSERYYVKYFKSDASARMVGPLAMSGVWNLEGAGEAEKFTEETAGRVLGQAGQRISPRNMNVNKAKEEITRNFIETEGVTGPLPSSMRFRIFEEDEEVPADDRSEVEKKLGELRATVDDIYGYGVRRICFEFVIADRNMDNANRINIVKGALRYAKERGITTELLIKDLPIKIDGVKKRWDMVERDILPFADRISFEAQDGTEGFRTILELFKAHCQGKSLEIYTRVNRDNQDRIVNIARIFDEQYPSGETDYIKVEWVLARDNSGNDVLGEQDYGRVVAETSRSYPNAPIDCAYPEENVKELYVNREGKLYIDEDGKKTLVAEVHNDEAVLDGRNREVFDEFKERMRKKGSYIPLSGSVKKPRKGEVLGTDDMEKSRMDLILTFPEDLRRHARLEEGLITAIAARLGLAALNISSLRYASALHHLGRLPRYQFIEEDHALWTFLHNRYKQAAAADPSLGHLSEALERFAQDIGAGDLRPGDKVAAVAEKIKSTEGKNELSPETMEILRAALDENAYIMAKADERGIIIPKKVEPILANYAGLFTAERSRLPNESWQDLYVAITRVASLFMNGNDWKLQDERGRPVEDLAKLLLEITAGKEGVKKGGETAISVVKNLLSLVADEDDAVVDILEETRAKEPRSLTYADKSFMRFLKGWSKRGGSAPEEVIRTFVDRKEMIGFKFYDELSGYLAIGAVCLPLVAAVVSFILGRGPILLPGVIFGTAAAIFIVMASRYVSVLREITKDIKDIVFRVRGGGSLFGGADDGKGSVRRGDTFRVFGRAGIDKLMALLMGTAAVLVIVVGVYGYWMSVSGFFPGALLGSSEVYIVAACHRIFIISRDIRTVLKAAGRSKDDDVVGHRTADGSFVKETLLFRKLPDKTRKLIEIQAFFWNKWLAGVFSFPVLGEVYTSRALRTWMINRALKKEKARLLPVPNSTADLNIKKMQTRKGQLVFVNGQWEWKEGDGIALIAGASNIKDAIVEVQDKIRAAIKDPDRICFCPPDKLHMTILEIMANTASVSPNTEKAERRKEIIRDTFDLIADAGAHDIRFTFDLKDLTVFNDGSIVLLGEVKNDLLSAVREQLPERLAEHLAPGETIKEKNIVHITIARIIDENISKKPFGGMNQEGEDDYQKIRRIIKGYQDGSSRKMESFVPTIYIWDQAQKDDKWVLASPGHVGPDEKIEIQGPERDKAPGAGRPHDLQGQDAPESHAVVEDLIKNGRMVELFIENKTLVARKVRWVEGYTPGKASSAGYLGEEVEIGTIFNADQIWNLKRWMESNDLPGFRGPVRFRISLDSAALGWDRDAEHSNIAHAGESDGVIYIGERMLRYLFSGDAGLDNEEGTSAELHLRERRLLIDEDEYRHLVDEDFDDKADPGAYQERLSTAQEIINVLLCTPPGKYGLNICNSHEEALTRHAGTDKYDARIKWGNFTPSGIDGRIVTPDYVSNNMASIPVTASLYIEDACGLKENDLRMKMWMGPDDNIHRWGEKRMQLVYTDRPEGGNGTVYYFVGEAPMFFQGEYTFKYSVDGGKTWRWANNGTGDNRGIKRSLLDESNAETGAYGLWEETARQYKKPGYRRAKVITLYKGDTDLSALLPDMSDGQGRYHDNIEEDLSDKYAEIHDQYTYGINGEKEGHVLLLYDEVNETIIVRLSGYFSEKGPAGEEGDYARRMPHRATIRIPLDRTGKARSVIFKPQTMGISRSGMALLLKHAGIDDNSEKFGGLFRLLQQELALYPVLENKTLEKMEDLEPVETSQIAAVLAAPENKISEEDINKIESIVYRARSRALTRLALTCLERLADSGNYDKNKYRQAERHVIEKIVLEGMAYVERQIRQDASLMAEMGIAKEDVKSVTIRWFTSDANKVVYRVTFRMKDFTARVFAFEYSSPVIEEPELGKINVEKAIELWASLSDRGANYVPHVFAVRKIDDYKPKVLDTPLPEMPARNSVQYVIDGVDPLKVVYDDSMIIVREFIEGQELLDYKAYASANQEEEHRVYRAGLEAYFRMWKSTKDPVTGRGAGLLDPSQRNVVVYMVGANYHGVVSELKTLRYGLSLMDLLRSLTGAKYEKELVLEAARGVLNDEEYKTIVDNYDEAEKLGKKGLYLDERPFILAYRVFDRDALTASADAILNAADAMKPLAPEENRASMNSIKSVLNYLSEHVSRSDNIEDDVRERLDIALDRMRRGEIWRKVRYYKARFAHGFGREEKMPVFAMLYAFKNEDTFYLSETLLKGPAMNRDKAIATILLRHVIRETFPEDNEDDLLGKVLGAHEVNVVEGHINSMSLRSYVKCVVEDDVLGIGPEKDLVSFQSLKDPAEAEKNAKEFLDSVCFRAVFNFAHQGGRFDARKDLAEYLMRHFGVRKFILAGGKGTRFSPEGIVVKQLFRPDNHNTNIKLTRTSAAFGKLDDIVVTDTVTIFNVMRAGIPVTQQTKTLALDDLGGIFKDMVSDGTITEEESERLLLAISSRVNRDLKYTRMEDGLMDLAMVARSIGDDVRASIGDDDLRVQFLMDKAAYAIFRAVIETSDVIDEKKKDELFGKNCRVIMDSGDGHGSAYMEALKELEDEGKLGEAGYSLIMHADSPGWGLDEYPNYNFICYLKAVTEMPRGGGLPRATIAVKNPTDGRAKGRARVYVEEEDGGTLGMAAAGLTEWNEMTDEEKRISQDMASKRDPAWFTNANILIVDTAWSMAQSDRLRENYKHFLGGESKKKRRALEYWSSDLVNMGASATRVVYVGQHAPNANKTLRAALEYRDRLQEMIVRKIKALGVDVDKGSTVSISSDDIGPGFEWDKVINNIFGDNLSADGKFGNIRIRGSVHLEATVKVGKGALLDGSRKQIWLNKGTTVARGAELHGTISEENERIYETRPYKEERKLLGGFRSGDTKRKRTQQVTGVDLSDLGLVTDERTRVWLIKRDPGMSDQAALKKIFGSDVSGEGHTSDQIYLYGDVILEDTARVESGTMLDGRESEVTLLGETLVRKGTVLKSVRAKDTTFTSRRGLDVYYYRQPATIKKDFWISNAIFENSYIEWGALVRDSSVLNSCVMAGASVENSDISDDVVVPDEKVSGVDENERRKILEAVLREDSDGEIRYIPGAYKLEEFPKADKEEIKEFQVRSAKKIYKMFVPEPLVRARLDEDTERFVYSSAAESLTVQQLREYFFAKIRKSLRDHFEEEPKFDKFMPMSDAMRDHAGTYMDKAKAAGNMDQVPARALLGEITLLSARANLLDPSMDPKRMDLMAETAGKGGELDAGAFLDRWSHDRLAIDAMDTFENFVFSGEKGVFLFWTDNMGEAEADAVLWQFLLSMGHEVVIAPKDGFSFGDIDTKGVQEVIDHYSLPGGLKEYYSSGKLRVIKSGYIGEGLMPHKISPDMIQVLNDHKLKAVISKGQANLFTVSARNRLRVPVVSIFLSKSQTSSKLTGISLVKGDKFWPIAAVISAGEPVTMPLSKTSFAGTMKKFGRVDPKAAGGHAFSHKDGMKWAMRTLLLAGAFSMTVLSLSLFNVPVPLWFQGALSGTTVFILLGSMRYYFLGLVTYRAIMKKMLAGRGPGDLVGEFEGEVNEQSAREDNIAARVPPIDLGYDIAFREKSGIVRYDPAFKYLDSAVKVFGLNIVRPEKAQELIRAHESFESHFWGMLAMFPVLGWVMWQLHMLTYPDQYVGPKMYIHSDYSNMDKVFETQIEANTDRFLDKSLLSAEPEHIIKVAGRPGLRKIFDRSTYSSVRLVTEKLLGPDEFNEPGCNFCRKPRLSREAPRTKTEGWAFSVEPAPAFTSEMLAFTAKHGGKTDELEVTGQGEVDEEYYYDVLRMLNGLKTVKDPADPNNPREWEVSWPSRLSTTMPGHMHVRLFQRAGKVPVEKYRQSPIFTDRNAQVVVSAVESYPDRNNAIAAFMVKGRADRMDKLKVFAKRCADLEKVIKGNGYEADKFMVKDRSGAIKVFFYPRTASFVRYRAGYVKKLLGPAEMSGLWTVQREEDLKGFGMKEANAALQAGLSYYSPSYQDLKASIERHFSETEGTGIFPSSMDYMVTYECNLHCPICWGSHMPIHKLLGRPSRHLLYAMFDKKILGYNSPNALEIQLPMEEWSALAHRFRRQLTPVAKYADGRKVSFADNGDIVIKFDDEAGQPTTIIPRTEHQASYLAKEARAVKHRLELYFSPEKGFGEITYLMFGQDGSLTMDFKAAREGYTRREIPADSHELREISLFLQKRMIDEMHANGMRRMVFSGGEPLLEPNIEEILKYAKEKGVTTWLFTNGLLMDEAKAARLMPYVDKISLSLDGYDDATNSANRRPGHFDAVMRVLKIMREHYSEKEVQVLTVVTQKNRNMLWDIGGVLRNESKGIGSFKWKLNYYRRIGRSKEETQVKSDPFLMTYEEFKEKAEVIKRSFLGMAIDYSPIEHDNAYLFVFPDGTLSTTVQAEYVELGNLFVPASFLDNKENLKTFREIAGRIRARAGFIPQKGRYSSPSFKRHNVTGREGKEIINDLQRNLAEDLRQHIGRVDRISAIIAHKLIRKGEPITREGLQILHAAAMLHDIGAQEKHDPALAEDLKRINSGIHDHRDDRVEPTMRKLSEWAQTKAFDNPDIPKPELKAAVEAARREGDHYGIYRLYIKYVALGRPPSEDLTRNEEIIARNLFSHGKRSVEILRERGVEFPEEAGFLIDGHHDYNAFDERLATMVDEGRMSQKDADMLRLLETVLITADAFEMGNNRMRSDKAGRPVEDFGRTLDPFNGFLWKRFHQMESMPDNKAVEALEEIISQKGTTSLPDRAAWRKMVEVVGEARQEKNPQGLGWLNDGDKRMMVRLREQDAWAKNTLGAAGGALEYPIKEVAIGIPSKIYKKMSAGDIESLRDIPGVSAIIPLDDSKGEAHMVGELSEKTKGTGSVSALIDANAVSPDKEGIDTAAELKPVIADFAQKVWSDIMRLADTDSAGIGEKEVKAINEVKGSPGIMEVLIRALPDCRSYEMTEKSVREMRIEKSYYELYDRDSGKSGREEYTDEAVYNAAPHYLVHFADGADVLDGSGPVVMPPGLEIQKRREAQKVDSRTDTYHDKFFVVAPEIDMSPAEKEDFRKKIMDIWMLEGRVGANDVVILDRKNRGTYTASEVYAIASGMFGKMTMTNGGLRVLCGELRYDLDAIRDSIIQVEISEKATSNLNQYEVFINLIISREVANTRYQANGLVKVMGWCYQYLPAVEAIDLEKEVKSYYDRYVREVLIKA